MPKLLCNTIQHLFFEGQEYPQQTSGNMELELDFLKK
jgi:hypothetical protein